MLTLLFELQRRPTRKVLRSISVSYHTCRKWIIPEVIKWYPN